MPFAFHNQQGHASKTDSLETPNEVHFRENSRVGTACTVYGENTNLGTSSCVLCGEATLTSEGAYCTLYVYIICTYAHTSSMVLLANGLLPSDHISYIVIP